MTKLRILTVDDDGDTRILLGHLLSAAGYEALPAADVVQALEVLSSESIDIVLSDIHLSGASGLDLLRQVRESHFACEVILLSGSPTLDSAIVALREGAADYLTKPVGYDVLLNAIARVEDRLTKTRQRQEALKLLEAGLKHFAGLNSSSASPTPRPRPAPVMNRQYRIGPIVLDLDRYVVEVNEQRIDMTPTELEILHCLCRHPDRVVTPQELVKSIRGYNVEANEAPEIVRPHMSNLRRKLLAASSEADVITTVRGMGYMLKTR